MATLTQKFIHISLLNCEPTQWETSFNEVVIEKTYFFSLKMKKTHGIDKTDNAFLIIQMAFDDRYAILISHN